MLRSVCLALGLLAATPAAGKELAWKPFTPEAFARAKAEKRFVILDLQAVWCHWCHVMEETTYRDPRVVSRLDAHYVLLRADADADLDLAARYDKYGWPATIIFASDGTEIVRRRGYIAPDAFVSLLDAIAEDPSPGPSVTAEPDAKPSAEGKLSDEQRAALAKTQSDFYDAKYGSWGERHKLIDADAIDDAFERIDEGDRSAPIEVQQTLLASMALLDPAWGGMYQYSDERDWKSPHYEKIMQIQADDLRVYAAAFARFGDEDWKKAANEIHRYLRDHLRSRDGAFFTSQDADAPGLEGKKFYALSVAARAKRAAPKIDTHLYARENGWAIAALCALYDATGDESALAEARAAAQWVLAHRARTAGGFRHGDDDRAPALGDTLAMGQAFLALYESTAEREWLMRAESAADFLQSEFRAADAGFVSVKAPAEAPGVFASAVRGVDENAGVARFANRLARYSGRAQDRALAEQGMRWLASPGICGSGRALPGILLADRELKNEPAHVTIVGAKKDPAALALYRAALANSAAWHRIEWLDPAEGPLPNADVTYPALARAAAFRCDAGTCSKPVFTPEELARP